MGHGPNRRETLTQVVEGDVSSTLAVLIFTPTWETAPGVYAIDPECKDSIEAQDYPDFEWYGSAENPYPVPDHRNVLHQYQKARKFFLAGRWAALLTVEHDNVLPDPLALQRMMDTPGDIVYAPYVLRHGLPLLSTWQYIGNSNLGESLSNRPGELKYAIEKNVYRVCGCGFGCTLIRRHVLEAIEFKPSSDANPCPDLGFAEAALRAGFVSNARFDVPVLHLEAHPGKATRRLHPFIREVGMQYIARQTVNVVVDGHYMHLTAGQPIELTEAEAHELNSVGYIDGAPPSPLAPAAASGVFDPLPEGEGNEEEGTEAEETEIDEPEPIVAHRTPRKRAKR